MNEEVNILVIEWTGEHVHNCICEARAFPTGLFEVSDDVVFPGADGPQNGEMGRDLGPTEFVAEAFHHPLDPVRDVIRYDGPRRIRLHLQPNWVWR